MPQESEKARTPEKTARSQIQVRNPHGGSRTFTVHGAGFEQVFEELVQQQRFGKGRVITLDGAVLPPPAPEHLGQHVDKVA